MSSRAVTHIVWDWNGTLANDHDAVLAATNEAFADVGMPSISNDAYRTRFRRPLKDFYDELAGRTLTPTEFARLDAAFHDRFRVHLSAAPLANDARAALARVRDWGATQSVLSMWRHDDLTDMTSRLGIAHWFLRIDGVAHTGGGGHKNEHLRQHIDRLHEEFAVDPAGCTAIGDTLDDAAAAAACGVKCVLVTGGTHPRSVLVRAAVPVVDGLLEALAVLGVGPAR